jgi:hypothetical protein
MIIDKRGKVLKNNHLATIIYTSKDDTNDWLDLSSMHFNQYIDDMVSFFSNYDKVSENGIKFENNFKFNIQIEKFEYTYLIRFSVIDIFSSNSNNWDMLLDISANFVRAYFAEYAFKKFHKLIFKRLNIQEHELINLHMQSSENMNFEDIFCEFEADNMITYLLQITENY